jgi:Organic Anion Transporter Polypeptide (OATP) family
MSAAAFQLSTDPIEVSNLTVQDLVGDNETTTAMSVSEVVRFYGGRAFSGPCPVDCSTMFYSYIALVCLLKFTGSSGRTSNFLVSVR